MKNDEYLNNDKQLADTAASPENNPAEEIKKVAKSFALTKSDDLFEISDSPEPSETKAEEEVEDTGISEFYTYEEYIEAFGDGDSDEYDEDDEDEAEQESLAVEEEETEVMPASEEIKVKSEDKKADKTEEKPRRVDSLFDFIELFVFTLAAVFIITSFFFRYSTVKGDSMQNTLQDEEKLLLSSFFYNPKPGDVVVVQDMSTELKEPIVKRIIAIEGQRVRITPYGVYVDGELLDEYYVYTGDYYDSYTGSRQYKYNVNPCLDFRNDSRYQLRAEDDYYEITVPDGEIFVMGDHRNNSKDSRDIGTLHEDAIIGKVVLRFSPFDKFGKIK